VNGVITAASQLDVDPRLTRLTDRGQVVDQQCASPVAHDTSADEVRLIGVASLLSTLLVLKGGSVAEWLACWTQHRRAWVQIAAATLSGNSL